MYRFLSLRILSVDDHKRGSSDVTFFFVGAVFGIVASAAVACSPSVPSCGQERIVQREEKLKYHLRGP